MLFSIKHNCNKDYKYEEEYNMTVTTYLSVTLLVILCIIHEIGNYLTEQ